MELYQNLAVIGFLFCLWQMCQTNILLHWEEDEPEPRRMLFFHSKQLRQLRMRGIVLGARSRSKSNLIPVMFTLYRCPARYMCNFIITITQNASLYSLLPAFVAVSGLLSIHIYICICSLPKPVSSRKLCISATVSAPTTSPRASL